MGDREDKNPKKNKKSKKAPKPTFTQMQVADQDLEALGETTGTWFLDGKTLTKKKKSNKGPGYATEGEIPQRESSKIRSLSDNEQYPIKTPADKAVSISPPPPEKLNINAEVPGTSQTPTFIINPIGPGYQLRGKLAPRALEHPESQPRASMPSSVRDTQTHTFKVHLKDEAAQPIVGAHLSSSEEEISADEEGYPTNQIANPENLGEGHPDASGNGLRKSPQVPIVIQSPELGTPPIRPPREKARTLPNCPPTRLRNPKPPQVSLSQNNPPLPFQDPHRHQKHFYPPQEPQGQQVLFNPRQEPPRKQKIPTPPPNPSRQQRPPNPPQEPPRKQKNNTPPPNPPKQPSCTPPYESPRRYVTQNGHGDDDSPPSESSDSSYEEEDDDDDDEYDEDQSEDPTYTSDNKPPQKKSLSKKKSRKTKKQIRYERSPKTLAEIENLRQALNFAKKDNEELRTENKNKSVELTDKNQAKSNNIVEKLVSALNKKGGSGKTQQPLYRKDNNARHFVNLFRLYKQMEGLDNEHACLAFKSSIRDDVALMGITRLSSEIQGDIEKLIE
jgi:hypothetical protein